MIFSKKVHFLDLDLVDSGLEMGFWRLGAIKMTVLRAQAELDNIIADLNFSAKTYFLFNFAFKMFSWRKF